MSATKPEMLKIKFLGTTIILLVLGGILVSAWKPENAKDLWLIIGPIVSGSIVYLAGHTRDSASIKPHEKRS